MIAIATERPVTDIVECVDWRRSHPDTARWKAYYAAFEVKHGRPSTNDEFDPDLSYLVRVIVNVLTYEMQKVMG